MDGAWAELDGGVNTHTAAASAAPRYIGEWICKKTIRWSCSGAAATSLWWCSGLRCQRPSIISFIVSISLCPPVDVVSPPLPPLVLSRVLSVCTPAMRTLSRVTCVPRV